MLLHVPRTSGVSEPEARSASNADRDAERGFRHDLEDAGNERTGGAGWVGHVHEVILDLDPGIPPVTPDEFLPEQLTEEVGGSATGASKHETPRKESAPPFTLGGRECAADLVEDVGRIGTSRHQADEVHDLGLGNAMLPPNLLPVSPDLGIHDMGEPQAPWKGHRQVLVDQDLFREILLLERLQQRESHAGVDAPTRVAGEFLGEGRRGEGHGYRGR